MKIEPIAIADGIRNQICSDNFVLMTHVRAPHHFAVVIKVMCRGKARHLIHNASRIRRNNEGRSVLTLRFLVYFGVCGILSAEFWRHSGLSRGTQRRILSLPQSKEIKI